MKIVEVPVTNRENAKSVKNGTAVNVRAFYVGEYHGTDFL